MDITDEDIEYCDDHAVCYVAGDECPECAKEEKVNDIPAIPIHYWHDDSSQA